MLDREIRVSCSALCRIEIGGRFLLEINKNQGDVLTPIGGALEFAESARPFLESLGATWEKEPELRLELPTEALPAFQEWFHKRENRETSPLRELVEELVEEHGLPLDAAMVRKAVPRFLGCLSEEAKTSRRGMEGTPTRYFHEIHEVILPAPVAQAALAMAEFGRGRFRLVDREAIERGVSNGYRVASTARGLLRFG